MEPSQASFVNAPVTDKPNSQRYEFNLVRAAEARAVAEATSLKNTRLRHLRSEPAWDELAKRMIATDQRKVAEEK
jgi:hypothetical protein